MQSNTYPIYKARNTVDGQKTPGGYFAVLRESAGKVVFIIMQTPGAIPDHGPTMTLDKADFVRLIDPNPVSFAIIQYDD